MAINYNDSRFADVEAQKVEAINSTNTLYDQMINQTDKYYQDQQNAIKNYADTQSKTQQQKTDFAIEKLEQQKAQKQEDYIREQKGAYVDYKKAIDEYGVEAEKQAANGLQNSGYSETSKITAFTTYQNRYGLARQSYERAVLEYDNGIKEAQLANNSALAEIAYNALSQSLELALEGFQYKNQLIQNKVDQLNTVENRFYQRYQDVVNQINTENALAEQQRQFNLSLSAKNSGGSSGRSSGSSKSNSTETVTEQENIDQDKVNRTINAVRAAYQGVPVTSAIVSGTVNRNNNLNASEKVAVLKAFGIS